MFFDMFPLDPSLLFYIKAFMFFTCVFFWIKLIYDSVQRSARMRRRDRDEEP